MFKIVTVIGARPQFIKAAAISRAIRNHFSDKVKEIILHTGQHYDPGMSAVFFDQLQIPREDYNLQVGSAGHGVQTAKIIIGIEEVLLKEKPGAIILYGDTNSTLAGAVAASKLHIPIVHIEAGMRSFTKQVPEEINRIMCDHVSTLLFSPTPSGVKNLYREGFAAGNSGPYNVDNPKVIPCGDIMYDNSLYFRGWALKQSGILRENGLTPCNYTLVTIHRENNTSSGERLSQIMQALHRLTIEDGTTVVIPLHPRTQKIMDTDTSLSPLLKNERLIVLPPASYLDMIALEANAEMIITDSGGVQKEAYYFEKPCIILQGETPWTELTDSGCALLADADTSRIVNAFRYFRKEKNNLKYPNLFGDGKAAEFTVKTILEYLQV